VRAEHDGGACAVALAGAEDIADRVDGNLRAERLHFRDEMVATALFGGR